MVGADYPENISFLHDHEEVLRARAAKKGDGK